MVVSDAMLLRANEEFNHYWEELILQLIKRANAVGEVNSCVVNVEWTCYSDVMVVNLYVLPLGTTRGRIWL